MGKIEKLNRLTMPFLAIGIAFVTLGVTLDDEFQLRFGFVWLGISLVAALVRLIKNIP